MSDDDGMTRRDELEALLPFYLNGTLAGSDLRRVEEWIANEPDGAIALAEAEAEFSGALSSNEAIRPPADALTRFNALLDKQAGTGRQSSRQSWLASLWRNLVGLPREVAWATAAAALTIAVLQAVVVGTSGPGGYTVAGAEDGDAPFVLVVFTPDARMADIADALGEEGASIVGGPLPGGMFRIAIPVEDVAEYDRIAAIIADAPFVATFVPGRKPDDAE